MITANHITFSEIVCFSAGALMLSGSEVSTGVILIILGAGMSGSMYWYTGKKDSSFASLEPEYILSTLRDSIVRFILMYVKLPFSFVISLFTTLLSDSNSSQTDPSLLTLFNSIIYPWERP